MPPDPAKHFQAESGPVLFPVDGHVHLHRAELVAPTLDAAAKQFVRVGAGTKDLHGALLLTQSSRERVFETLAGVAAVGDWTLERIAEEPQTLLARRDGICLALVCGRQVRADNGIEVSALGTCLDYDDGRSFGDTLDAVRRSGVVTMIPWGLGKWSGRRGRMVEAAVRGEAPDLWIGDSGCRWRGWPAHALLRPEGAASRILAGTDPFPYLRDYRRVGSFGFIADIEPSTRAPWRDMQAWLRGLRGSPTAFGRPSVLPRFVANQVGIHFYNRMRRLMPR